MFCLIYYWVLNYSAIPTTLYTKQKPIKYKQESTATGHVNTWNPAPCAALAAANIKNKQDSAVILIDYNYRIHWCGPSVQMPLTISLNCSVIYCHNVSSAAMSHSGTGTSIHQPMHYLVKLTVLLLCVSTGMVCTVKYGIDLVVKSACPNVNVRNRSMSQREPILTTCDGYKGQLWGRNVAF